jgi:hypothetical protein
VQQKDKDRVTRGQHKDRVCVQHKNKDRVGGQHKERIRVEHKNKNRVRGQHTGNYSSTGAHSQQAASSTAAQVHTRSKCMTQAPQEHDTISVSMSRG